MPWFHEFLTSISRAGMEPRPSLGRRVLAAVLSAILLLGSISPGAALAGEVDSEGEGSAPPGAIEGGPELDPGGEETVLEEVPGSASGGGSEETGEGPPVESEPAQEAEPPPLPLPSEVTGTEAEALPGATQPSSEEASSAPAPGPEYGPAYEPAPTPPSSTPVENQPLKAPEGSPAERHSPAAQGIVETAPEESAPPPPVEVPESEPAQPAATPVERNEPSGSLAGRHVHTVRPGECLWSIAAALLPGGAGNAEIAAEVQRLWRLNAARIGTGNPNLLYAGTELRLR